MTEKERKRIKSYYKREQYNPENFNNNTPNLFEDTIEIFNPVKDITKALVSAAIKDLQTKNELLTETWDYNKMASFSKKICKEMYLEETVFVEIVKDLNDNIRYFLHNIDNVQYTENFGQLIYFQVSGEIEFYGENGEPQTKEFTREYKKLENGSIKFTEIIDGQKFEKPFLLDRIPCVRFNTDSNIIEALNIIDKINEEEAYISNLFDIHGDPVMQAGNLQQFADANSDNEKIKKNAETLEKARYKNKRIIFTPPSEKEAFFKYIELSRPLITEMQKNIERLEKRLSNLFPEFLLVDTKTQNVSQETYSMKNNGLRTKILSFRTDFLKGLVDLDNSALELMGRNPNVTEDDYTYLDPFEESEKTSRLQTLNLTLDVIQKAQNLDLEANMQSTLKKIQEDAIKDLEGIYD